VTTKERASLVIKVEAEGEEEEAVARTEVGQSGPSNN